MARINPAAEKIAAIPASSKSAATASAVQANPVASTRLRNKTAATPANTAVAGASGNTRTKTPLLKANVVATVAASLLSAPKGTATSIAASMTTTVKSSE